MQANGTIAIYNATREELYEVADAAAVEAYWLALDKDEAVYTLTDYAFVDADVLLGAEHDELLADGWAMLTA